MATIGSATTKLPSAQISMYEGRLQQARRDTSQAQERVRELEAQTERARSEAARAEDRLRGVERQAPQGREVRQPSVVNTQGQVTGRVLSLLA